MNKSLNKYLKYIIIGGLFLVPIVPLIIADGNSITSFFFPSLLFPFITGKNFFFRIIIEIVFASWLVLALRDRSYWPKKSLLLWSLVVFLGVIAVADMFSVNPSKSIWSNYERMEGLVTHIHLFFYFIVAGTMLSSRKIWDYFMHTSIGVGIFLTLYSFLQLGHELVINQGGARVDGTLGNATYLAIYFLFNIFLLIFFCYSNRARIEQILWSIVGGSGGFILFYLSHISNKGVRIGEVGAWLSIVSLSMIFGALYLMFVDKRKLWLQYAKTVIYLLLIAAEMVVLYFTATRGAVLGLIGGFIFVSIAVAIFERKNKALRYASIGLIVLVLSMVGTFIKVKDNPKINNNPVLSRFSSLLKNDPKTFFTSGQGKSRYLNAKTALNGFEDRPILGWGQESFNYVFYKHYEPKMYSEEPWFDRTHNIILDWLIAGGVLGLIAYLSILVSAIYYLLRRRKEDNPESQDNLSYVERVVIVGLLAAYFIQNLTVFDNITSYIMFFTVLAYIHYSYGTKITTSVQKDNSSVNIAALSQVVIPIIIVGLFASLYFVNIKGILASTNLIHAMTPQSKGLDQNLQYFKKALSYDSFGSPEVREFLAQATQEVFSSSADAATKEKFISLTKNEFEKQLKSTPEDARYYYLAGVTMERLRKYEEALYYLEKGNSISPKKQGLMLELGVIYINMGDLEKANAIFKKAYGLAPDYDQAKIMYALSLIYSKNENLAREILGTKYIDLIDTDQRFINAFAETGQYSRIISIWKKFIEKDPTNVQYRASLAATYLKLNNVGQAIAEIRKAIEINPQFKKQGESLIANILSGKGL